MAVSTSLERVLRIRAMQEELARSELELEAAHLRGIERRAEEAAGEALASRGRWFAAVEKGSAEGGAEAEPERAGEESVWELAVSRRRRAEAWRPAQQAEVERARTEYLGGRRERMQVESLLAAAKSLERGLEERAEQRRLDDWYQARASKPPGTEEAEAQGPEREGIAREA